MEKDRIGIMGGTFDPVHNGHIQLAVQAHVQFDLKEILFMPSGEPPHKAGKLVNSQLHRSNMVKLAIQPYTFLTFSDYEVAKQGFSYSADMLTELTKQFKDIFFILGADSLFNIKKWYHPEIVMSHCTLLVADRDRHGTDELNVKIASLIKEFDAKIKILHVDDIPISSTDIRTRIRTNLPITELVPAKVEKYIYDYNLYI